MVGGSSWESAALEVVVVGRKLDTRLSLMRVVRF